MWIFKLRIFFPEKISSLFGKKCLKIFIMWADKNVFGQWERYKDCKKDKKSYFLFSFDEKFKAVLSIVELRTSHFIVSKNVRICGLEFLRVLNFICVYMAWVLRAIFFFVILSSHRHLSPCGFPMWYVCVTIVNRSFFFFVCISLKF